MEVMDYIAYTHLFSNSTMSWSNEGHTKQDL